jgi:hypothetical protein
MSKNKDNIIIWEKWRDPFGLEDSDIEEMISRMEEAVTANANDADDGYEEEDIEENIQEQEEAINFLSNNLQKPKIPMIITPFGFVPYTENTATGKIFNFWVGHTNFNISKTIAKIVEESLGVETLDVFTRYRFRIGIGKAFKDSSVMHSINTQIYEYLELEDNEKN